MSEAQPYRDVAVWLLQREPYELRGSRPVVCPGKAGMFSRGQTCGGKSQRPRSLDSRKERNRISEAYRRTISVGDVRDIGP
jgi:hypothetical protein